MENNVADCTALNPQIVENIRPQMPEDNLLYGLSDFF